MSIYVENIGSEEAQGTIFIKGTE